MITLPNSVVLAGKKLGRFAVKHGPKIMTVAGAGMAFGGAVMACKATLRCDEVLDKHKERMAQIEAARELSMLRLANNDIDDPSELYTEKDMRKDKFMTYAMTGVGFAKLYGPAFAVGMGGIGLMEAAFVITENRRSAAVAALTSMDALFQEYKNRVNRVVTDEQQALIDNPHIQKQKVQLPWAEDEEEMDCVVIDTEEGNPYVYWFDKTCPDWNGTGTNYFLSNRAHIEGQLTTMQYELSKYGTTHFWINDFIERCGGLKNDNGELLDAKTGCDVGRFHGWDALAGDAIDYKIQAYAYSFDGDDDKQFPILIPISKEDLMELESLDIPTDYCFEITLKGCHNIYHNVYGE